MVNFKVRGSSNNLFFKKIMGGRSGAPDFCMATLLENGWFEILG